MKDKEAKKKADQQRHEQELRSIRVDNQSDRHEANTAHKNQYRTTGDQNSKGSVGKPPAGAPGGK